MHLVDVHKENQALKEEVQRLKLDLAIQSEKADAAKRLESLLGFRPPQGWSTSGARVVAQNYGPLGVLESIVIDKGKLQGIRSDLPVITPEGVVGRTFKVGLNFSTVLLFTDPNSRIPVISSESRVQGVLSGQGYDQPLDVYYVELNAPLKEGEILKTSGTAGIYPKGLPVAEVDRVKRSDIHLFQIVEASDLFSLRGKEEVLVLSRQRHLKEEYSGVEGVSPGLSGPELEDRER